MQIHTHTHVHMYILTLMQIVQKESEQASKRASEQERECVQYIFYCDGTMCTAVRQDKRAIISQNPNTVNAQVSHTNPEFRYDFCFIQAWFEIIKKKTKTSTMTSKTELYITHFIYPFRLTFI